MVGRVLAGLLRCKRVRGWYIMICCVRNHPFAARIAAVVDYQDPASLSELSSSHFIVATSTSSAEIWKWLLLEILVLLLWNVQFVSLI